MNKKEFINEIYNDKKQSDSNSRSLASMLESTIHTGFHDPHKFIYEILQNADDANASKIIFSLRDDYLIISYNGENFEKDDIVRICDVSTHRSSNKNSKVYNSDKIGYKGIGFKSVFCISEKVTVVSNQWQFRFDKSHWEREGAHPWQIIPIYTEVNELPPLLNPQFYTEKVNIVLQKITCSIENLRNELENISKQHEAILFLNNIESIIFEHNNESSELVKKELSSDPKGIFKQISYRYPHSTNAPITRQWCIFTHDEIKVENAVLNQLKILNDAECPQKIKNNSITKIFFAAEFDQAIIPVKEGKLYCGLPTTVESGLFYLVNANFLLNQDRTNILNNSWNGFLLEKIGELSFKWFANMSKLSMLKASVLSLLNDESGVLNDYPLIAKKYKLGYKRGINNIAFVPSIDGKLLKANHCIFDETKFFDSFYESIKDQDFQTDKNLWQFIDLKLNTVSIKNVKQLISTDDDIRSFNISHLLDKIENYIYQVKTNMSLMLDMLKFVMNNENSIIDYFGCLRKKKLFLTEDNKLEAADNLFFLPDENNDKENYNYLKYIKERYKLKIASDYYIKSDFSTELIVKLQLEPLTLKNFVKKYIFSLIADKKITSKNTVDLLQIVYKAYITCPRDFSEDDFDKLSAFPVLCGRNEKLLPVHRCYFGLDKLIDDKNFLYDSSDMVLSKKYYVAELNDTDRFNDWKVLLKKMNININIGMILKDKLLYTKAKKIFSEKIDSYIEEVLLKGAKFKPPGQAGKFYPITSSFQAEKVWFENFIYFNSFEQILKAPEKSSGHIYLMWLAIYQDWEKFNEPCKYAKQRSGKDNKPDTLDEHFLLYCLKKYNLTKVCGKNSFKKTGELIYSPSHIDLMKGVLLVPDLPVILPENQASRLGFRLFPTINECLELLSKQTTKESPELSTIAKIYTLILESNEKTTKENIVKWKKNNKMIDVNKVWQPAINLKIYDGEGIEPLRSSQWLNPCELSTENLLKLAKILHMPKFSDENICSFDSPSKGTEEEKQGQKHILEIKEKFLSCLPLYSIIATRQNDKTPQDFLEEILIKFKELEIHYSRNLINFSGKNKHAHLTEKTLFFYTSLRKINRKCWVEIASELVSFLGLKGSATEQFKKFLSDENSLKHESSVSMLENNAQTVENLKKIIKDYKDLDSLPDDLKQMLNITDPSNDNLPLNVASLGSRPPVDDEVIDSPTGYPDTTSTPPPSTPTNYTPGNTPNILPGKRKPSNSQKNFPVTESPKESNEVKRARGNSGERIVFDLLKHHYINKYHANGSLKPNDSGKEIYECYGVYKNNSVTIQIVWHDPKHNMSSCMDHDITVKKLKLINNEKKETSKYVEVKTTKYKYDESPYVSLSKNEWKLSVDKPNNSVLYIVFGVFHGVDRQRIYKIKNNISHILRQTLHNQRIIPWNEKNYSSSFNRDHDDNDIYIDIKSINFRTKFKKISSDSKFFSKCYELVDGVFKETFFTNQDGDILTSAPEKNNDNNLFGHKHIKPQVTKGPPEESSNICSFSTSINASYPKPEKTRISSAQSKKTISSNLGQIVGHYGLICKDVPRDGNCFFHAVFRQLPQKNRNQFNNENSIREAAVNHVREYIDLYRNFIPNDNASVQNIDRYINKLYYKEEWADSLLIFATSRVLRATLAIIPSDESEPVIIRQKNDDLEGHRILLGYEVGIHYQILESPQELPSSSPQFCINDKICEKDYDTFIDNNISGNRVDDRPRSEGGALPMGDNPVSLNSYGELCLPPNTRQIQQTDECVRDEGVKKTTKNKLVCDKYNVSQTSLFSKSAQGFSKTKQQPTLSSNCKLLLESNINETRYHGSKKIKQSKLSNYKYPSESDSKETSVMIHEKIQQSNQFNDFSRFFTEEQKKALREIFNTAKERYQILNSQNVVGGDTLNLERVINSLTDKENESLKKFDISSAGAVEYYSAITSMVCEVTESQNKLYGYS